MTPLAAIAIVDPPIANEDDPPRRRVQARVIAAAVAGNALEFYDFVTYAFFAVYIGRAFFPASTPFASLLLSVGVFGVGFVARPLGGVVIGAFADRFGRRPAMLGTIGLITLGTLGLGLTPSYESIGLAAPIVVVACRLVQGLALGGEVGPASAFLVEAAPPGRHGLYAGWQVASQGAAALLAGVFGLGLTSRLGDAEMAAWGWRVPFLAGLLLVPVAIYLRRRMPETLEPSAGETSPRGLAGLGPYRRLILVSIAAGIAGTVSTYVVSFMTTYAITTLRLPATVAMGATIAGGAATFVFSLVGGWLADRIGRKPTMLWPRIAAGIAIVPAFGLLLARSDPAVLLGVTAFLSALTAMSATALIATTLELLPQRVRATGMSIAYAISVSLFGGTTQLVVAWLIGVTGNPAAPAWYVAGASVISALAMGALPESRPREPTAKG